MQSIKAPFLLFVAACLLLGRSASVPAQSAGANERSDLPRYTITQISLPARLTQVTIHGMNGRGEIVGTMHLPDSGKSAQAFVYRSGQLLTIDASYHSEAWSINDRGQIAGCYSQSDGDMQAALWQIGRAGQPVIRVPLGAGIARSVTNKGQVAIDGNDGQPGALWTPTTQNALTGRRQPLTVNAKESIFPRGVEDARGRVVLDGIDGMNERGQVLLHFQEGGTDGPPIHAAVWQKGKARRIENNAHYTHPAAINDAGQVVGMASFAYHPDPDGGFVGVYFFHAFVAQEGEFRDIGTLFAAAESQSEARAINRKGVIVGGASS